MRASRSAACVGVVSGVVRRVRPVARLDRCLAAVLRDRAVDRVADDDEELLDGLGVGVVEDGDGDRLRLLTRGERERADTGGVVGARLRRAVGRVEATVTVRSVVPASVTVKVAPSPSRPGVSEIESVGGAFLSMIVPSPCASIRLTAGTPIGLESRP